MNSQRQINKDGKNKKENQDEGHKMEHDNDHEIVVAIITVMSAALLQVQYCFSKYDARVS